MLNRFSMKQSHSKNINNSPNFHLFHQVRVKRTYNAMLEQSNNSQSIPFTFPFSSKRLKQSEGKPPESLIKNTKPKIQQKILKEIERYNSQRYSYNKKIITCPCYE